MGRRRTDPIMFDFTSIDTLRRAERTFYCMGCSPEDALRILDEQLGNLEELARFICAHVCASVLDDPRAATDPVLVDTLQPESARFDAGAIRARYRSAMRQSTYRWTFDASVMAPFFEGQRAEPIGETIAAVC
jgi:hypothetical protein